MEHNKHYNESYFNNSSYNSREKTLPLTKTKKQEYIKTKRQNVVVSGVLAGFCLGLLLSLAISIPIAFEFKDSKDENTNEQNLMTPMLMISGEASKDWMWHPDLANTTSEAFREMSNRFCSLMDLSFAMSSLKDSYDSCRVRSMRNGSIFFNFDIVMAVVIEDDNMNNISQIFNIASSQVDMLSLSEMRVVIGSDNCEGILCENDGSCVDAVNFYFCNCTDGFYGDLCQHRISDTNVACTESPQSTSSSCEECVCPSSPVPDSVTFSPVSCETVTCPQCQDCNDATTCPPPPGAATCPVSMTTQNQSCPACNVTCPDVTTCGPCDDCTTLAPPTDHCKMNPCENSGTCVQDDGRSYCLCSEGWTGDNCTVALHCHMEPCRENGTCIENTAENTFECICSHNYGPPNCTTGIYSPCELEPCAENSTCYETSDGTDYFCACPTGFTSKNCSVPVTLPCDEPTTVCLNGSTCVNLENGTHICLCADGFSGNDCSDAIELPCDDNPCEGSGSRCINQLSGGYFCECGPRLGGTNCSLISSACEDSLCNSGTCLDLEDGSYHCLCPDGVEGVNCSIDIPSVCEVDGATDLCGNGTCKEANFTCMCDEGYQGLNCSMEVLMPCSSDPCENGGTCYSLENGQYHCACTQNFTGTECTESLDLCADQPCVGNSTCYNVLGGDYVCLCPDTTETTNKNCSVEVSCPTPYTYVDGLGCFHLSPTAEYSQTGARTYCEDTLSPAGTRYADLVEANVDKIADVLNTMDKIFHIGVPRAFGCNLYNLMGNKTITAITFNNQCTMYHILCKYM